MRILATGFTDNYGGVETFVMSYYRIMKKLDQTICIDIVTPYENPAFKNEIINMGGKVHVISAANKLKSRFLDKKKQKNDIYKIMLSNNYDAMWCNKNELCDLTYLKLSMKAHIPIRILHSHNSKNMHKGFSGMRIGLMHNINKFISPRYSTQQWACSDTAAQWMFPKKSNYYFVANAVDAKKLQFKPQIRELYREKMMLSNKFVVGVVARISYQKNPEFIIDIFNELHKIKQDSVLLWAGTGERKAKIEAQAKLYGILDSVIFLGSRQDISELMQAMDCLLFPSRFEGLGIVAIESQAAGLHCFMSKDVIPKETDVTSITTRVSLGNSAKIWAEEIAKKNLLHKDMYEEIVDSGYDINHTAKSLLFKLKELNEKNE